MNGIWTHIENVSGKVHPVISLGCHFYFYLQIQDVYQKGNIAFADRSVEAQRITDVENIFRIVLTN